VLIGQNCCVRAVRAKNKCEVSDNEHFDEWIAMFEMLFHLLSILTSSPPTTLSSLPFFPASNPSSHCDERSESRKGSCARFKLGDERSESRRWLRCCRRS
jgi:hypothetical protein